jgi:SAM-dependent methyltransferase
MLAIWPHVKPPLKPQAADLERMQAAVYGLAAEMQRPPRAMMLGVTAEIARMDWPAGTRLTAVDSSAAMIRHVWPGTRDGIAGAAVLGDWFDPPHDLRALDVVICDGGPVLVRYPHDAARLLRTVAERLRPGGLLILRAFVRPARRETVDDVFAALDDGQVSNFHELKFRVLMALQPTPREGVAVRGAYQTIMQRTGGHEALAQRTGWPIEEIRTVEAYRENDSVYAYPSPDEYRALLGDAGFAEQSVTVSNYPMGERCPLFVCRNDGTQGVGT